MHGSGVHHVDTTGRIDGLADVVFLVKVQLLNWPPVVFPAVYVPNNGIHLRSLLVPFLH